MIEIMRKAGFKYVDKTYKNGRWVYTYPEDTLSGRIKNKIQENTDKRNTKASRNIRGILSQLSNSSLNNVRGVVNTTPKYTKEMASKHVIGTFDKWKGKTQGQGAGVLNNAYFEHQKNLSGNNQVKNASVDDDFRSPTVSTDKFYKDAITKKRAQHYKSLQNKTMVNDDREPVSGTGNRARLRKSRRDAWSHDKNVLKTERMVNDDREPKPLKIRPKNASEKKSLAQNREARLATTDGMYGGNEYSKKRVVGINDYITTKNGKVYSQQKSNKARDNLVNRRQLVNERRAATKNNMREKFIKEREAARASERQRRKADRHAPRRNRSKFAGY